jgi:hypothetical protein
MQQRDEFLTRGPDKFRQRVLDRNLMRASTNRRDRVRNMAAAANEIKDWLPVLSDFERTGRWHPGMRRAMAAGISAAPSVAPSAPSVASARTASATSRITVVSH